MLAQQEVGILNSGMPEKQYLRGTEAWRRALVLIMMSEFLLAGNFSQTYDCKNCYILWQVMNF